MKYVQPLNATDADAPYKNADPANGQKGSTVPAAAIESPMREIVNLIEAAGLTPSETDLTQMAQAIDAKIAASATNGHNVGDVFYTARTDSSLNGAVECNGAQYNIADFNTGEQSVAALLAAGKLPYISMAAYDAVVAAHGSCRCFGWDGTDATVFKVPKLNDVYIEAGTATNAGEFINESVPNHYHVQGASASIDTGVTGRYGKTDTSNSNTSHYDSGGTGRTTLGYNTSGVYGSSAYQYGAKVRPDSVRYRAMVQLATAASDEALTTCTSVFSDVAGLKTSVATKVNTDLSNCTKPYVIETYRNGTEWYRLWSDGWIEQGGFLSSVTTTQSSVTVNLLKTFSNTNYTVQLTNLDSGTTNFYASFVQSKYVNRFIMFLPRGKPMWYACGY